MTKQIEGQCTTLVMRLAINVCVPVRRVMIAQSCQCVQLSLYVPVTCWYHAASKWAGMAHCDVFRYACTYQHRL